MDTQIITVDRIDEAAQCIKDGGTVVFPTETVYGLGADSTSLTAIQKIYTAKGRPSDNPLIVHISGIEMLSKLAAEVTPKAKLLIDKFWPGPLTLIFKKHPSVDYSLTGGRDTVAVRFPSNRIAQMLISLSGKSIAAPSANLSGSPSPTVCCDVIDDLYGRVDYIIDGSECEIGLESTIVDVSGEETVVLRPGAVTLEMIREYIPDAYLDSGLIDSNTAPKCPGQKYTHYSPKAKVVVVQGEKNAVCQYIQQRIRKESDVGVLTYFDNKYDGAKLILNSGNNMTSYAHNLFSYLRQFDKHGVKTVYAEFKIEDGMGTAVMNRLYKSSGYTIIEV